MQKKHAAHSVAELITNRTAAEYQTFNPQMKSPLSIDDIAQKAEDTELSGTKPTPRLNFNTSHQIFERQSENLDEFDEHAQKFCRASELFLSNKT